MEEANERKHPSTRTLWRSAGSKTDGLEPMEVGFRGFAGKSLCKVLTMLSVNMEAKRMVIRAASEFALDDFGSRGQIHGQTVLGHRTEPDQLWLELWLRQKLHQIQDSR